MNYLYILGGSGCGKSTLAKKIAAADPNKYKYIIGYTTREIRSGEIPGVDLHFIDDHTYDILLPNMFQTVQYQLRPIRYGSLSVDNDPDKWNILVVSMEGFVSGQKNWKDGDSVVLLNIITDCKMDIARDHRDPKMEENFNMAILHNYATCDDHGYMHFGDKTLRYKELPLSELKKIRNNNDSILKYINAICG